jgi:hypothetical protein
VLFKFLLVLEEKLQTTLFGYLELFYVLCNFFGFSVKELAEGKAHGKRGVGKLERSTLTESTS